MIAIPGIYFGKYTVGNTTVYISNTAGATTETATDSNVRTVDIVVIRSSEAAVVRGVEISTEDLEDKERVEPEPLPIEYEIIDRTGNPLDGWPNFEHRTNVKARPPPVIVQDRLNMVAYAGTRIEGKGNRLF